MTGSTYVIFQPELVHCVADGCDPSQTELLCVACRVWMDGAANRSAFAWDQLSPTHPDRTSALRIAQAALAGSAGPPLRVAS